MAAGMVLILGMVIVAVRVKALVRVWRMPTAYGAGKCFGLPVPQPAARRLVRRYRGWLLAPLPLEAVVIAVILWQGTLWSVMVEQAMAALVVALVHTLVAIHFVRQAKWAAAQDSWKPASAVALSLIERRLADYTSVPFEIALAAGSILAFGMLAAHCLSDAAFVSTSGQGVRLDEVAEEFAFSIFLLYLQLGGLLLKHGLVHWRMWLPGQRTEEYLRWREAVLQHYVWACDFLRGCCTAVLLLSGLQAQFGSAWDQAHMKLVALAVLIGVVFMGLAKVVQHRRRLSALFQELQPLEAIAAPPRRIDPREFSLGGLLYYNPENPALFVASPLVFTINLGNRRAYWYSAYVAGLVFLVAWLHA